MSAIQNASSIGHGSKQILTLSQHDDSTTYHIQPGCSPSATAHCDILDPPITLILAPSCELNHAKHQAYLHIFI